MMTTASTGAPETIVPADLDAGKWAAIEPMLDALDSRRIVTAEDLERWLIDRSELTAAYLEADTVRYIAMTRRTDDEAAQRAYSEFVETIPPKIKPRDFALDQKLVEKSSLLESNPRYEVLLRDTVAGVEIYRDENVPIETELAKLEQRYGQVIGAMSVEYDGQERTLPQMAVYQESTDRRVRESSWVAVARRRTQDGVTLDGLFDEMVALRDRAAKNAGEPTFIEYGFKAKRRFDYTPGDCEAFHDAVAAHVVPLNDRLAERRRVQMGVDRLRPWDLSVDPRGRGPLRPFRGGVELFEKTRRVFGRLDTRLAGMFLELGEGLDENAEGENLDLDSRKGKAPGGYQAMRDRARKPFIFMNAAGVQRDVETMVHEAGHAFHSMLCVREPLVHYRSSPIEFAEVASMSMELLTMPYWDEFYRDESDLARARRGQIESSVGMLAWIAMIDAFQHWVYRHPGHTRAQRTEAWLALDERFGFAGKARVDFGGLDPRFRESFWHKQLHLFTAPLYYIEYGIAQLGALSLWERSLNEGERVAVDAYMQALKLGGSRPLPELFRSCGVELDFGAANIARLVELAEREMDKLPE